MDILKIIINRYDPQTYILETTLAGLMTMDDILVWDEGFQQGCAEAIQNGAFMVITNGIGYESQVWMCIASGASALFRSRASIPTVEQSPLYITIGTRWKRYNALRGAHRLFPWY